jgi:EAL domain-containing protein (putative c-di-GMP-specific phosphodiesterase class I)
MCSVSLSVGAASTVQLGPDASILLAAAEAASALAKDAGGDRVYVYQSDESGPPVRGAEGEWTTRIAAALADDRFQLFAQRVAPIDDPVQLGQCSYEILLRMEGNNGGLLPPMAFLPAAERCRLMPQVDRWVIDRTLRALAPYLREQIPNDGPSYSLNLSAASLGDETLLDFILAELAHTSVPPERICFEVAEAVAVSHLHQAGVLAKGLKGAGCRFALDHFHSGVGAYAYLQDLPVDYVKIDGSFIKGMLSDPLDCAVVEGISRIGQALGIEIVAQCAETPAILSRLKDLGVMHAQGYLIHRPAPLLEALEAQVLEAELASERPAIDWAVEWYQG